MIKHRIHQSTTPEDLQVMYKWKRWFKSKFPEFTLIFTSIDVLYGNKVVSIEFTYQDTFEIVLPEGALITNTKALRYEEYNGKLDKPSATMSINLDQAAKILEEPLGCEYCKHYETVQQFMYCKHLCKRITARKKPCKEYEIRI